MNRLLLSLDGGGAMGVIMAIVLAALEAVLHLRAPTVRLCQIFDLIIGTSTGSILGAFLAGGGRASQGRELYETVCPKLFGTAPFRNYWIERPTKGKYSREAFIEELKNWIPRGKMSELQTIFVSVVECLETRLPHFFKSDDTTAKGSWRPDADLSVMECVARSGFSAPLYFRPVDDEERKLTWIDGGSGSQNCPMEQAIMEAIIRGWAFEGPVKILSLGTGYSDPGIPHAKAKRHESWRAVGDFLPWARAQAEKMQGIRYATGWSRVAKNIDVKRVTIEVPKAINGLDLVQYMPEYVRAGETLALQAEEIAEWLGEVKA